MPAHDRNLRSVRGRDPDSASGVSPARVAATVPGEIVVRATIGDTLDALAADLMAQALTCAARFGDFHLAVGGDQSIEAVYLRLMSDPVLRAMPWSRTHLWLTHDQLGAEGPIVFPAVRECLVDHAGIPVEQIHAIDLAETEPVEVYESTLRASLRSRPRGGDRLDAAVVTLDAAGRIGGLDSSCSAAPGAASIPERWCLPLAGGGVSLSGSFLRASRLLAVCVLGVERGRALSAWADTDPGPIAGETRWYLDADAAGVCG